MKQTKTENAGYVAENIDTDGPYWQLHLKVFLGGSSDFFTATLTKPASDTKSRKRLS